MRYLSKTCLIVALLTVASGAAAAPPAKAPAAAARVGQPDVRCLMTMVALGQDKARQQAAQAGVYFFAGRLSATRPGLDLAAAMRAEAPTLGAAELQAESRRCGPMITASAQGVQAALNALRPPGAPPPAAPAAQAPAALAPAPAAPPPR